MGNHYHAVLQVDEEGRLSDGPVRARLIREPCRWKWSSMRATVGLPVRREERPRFLDVDWVLGHFCDDRAAAPFVFNRYVEEGIGKPRPVPPEPC